MNLPLHNEAQEVSKEKDGFHAGLWFDRFFDRYDENWKVPKDEKGKLAWINTVTTNPVGSPEKLAAFTQRQHAFVASLGGEHLTLATDWHFVTGMGNNHPVENGFAWHHTLGVPYLTGAAVKGMVRAWCEAWQSWKLTDKEKKENPALKDDPRLKQWFGDKQQSGELIFFDAVPTKPVQLKADIMTPHYGDWYAKGNEEPKRDGTNVPADWHDPNPIPFLVVDKGASYQFAVAKRASSEINLDEVLAELKNALEWIGAGAKTSAGYGRFSEGEAAKRLRETQEKEAARLAQEKAAELEAEKAAEALGLSGLSAEIHSHASQANWLKDKGAFIREAGEWLDKIEGIEGEEQHQAAQVLAEFMEIHDKGILANPKKTKGKKNKAVYKPNSIALAEALNKLIQP